VRWWNGLSFRISAASIAALIVVVVVANVLSRSAAETRLNQVLEAEASGILDRWKLGLIEPVWNLNTDQAKKLVEVEFNNRAVIAAQVVDASNAALVGVLRQGDGLVAMEKPPERFYKAVKADLMREDEKIGEALLWLSDETIQAQLAAATRADLWKFLGVGLALVVVLNILLSVWVTRPLGRATGLIGKMLELKPGEPLDEVRRLKNQLVGRYGGNHSETGTLIRALDRFVGLFGELKHSTDAAQRAVRGLTCASANMLLLDEGGKLVLINDAFAAYLQRQPEVKQALGKGADVVAGVELADAVSGWLGGGLKGLTQARQAEIEIGPRHGMLDVSPIVSDRGETLGYVVQWHDMTEQLKRQAMERGLTAELSRVVSEASAGNLSERISTRDAEGVLAELAGEVNQLLDSFDDALRRIREMHDALAAGNLGYRLHAPDWTGVFAAVRDNANSTIARLASLVATLREAARSVASGASEIRAGTDELSRRIEQQAASLEESSAAMRDMTQSVTNNERDSRDASTQSAAADEAAKRGGEAISRMQTRMSEIGKGSRRIMEIVGLIDDIAFQTNLLALNAAVEAARAGDMGRGFAVVATEVRALAKRAADNAKDIRTLLSSSDSEVQHGISLAGSLSQSIAEISEAVGRAAALSRTIAGATADQAQGIRQVEAVIADLDGITQQNSAIAEETAAASATLDDQAAKVLELLSSFSLGETETSGRAAAAQRKERKAS